MSADRDVTVRQFWLVGMLLLSNFVNLYRKPVNVNIAANNKMQMVLTESL